MAFPYRRLKVAPEYGAGPLWDGDWDGYREICPMPSTLGLSAALVADLDAWQAEWDATLAPHPPDSAFPSAEAEAQWRQRGAELADRLRSELGADVEVTLRV